MAVYFLDTSAIVKRYVLETGTAWVQALTAPAAGNVHCLARITRPEAVAAIRAGSEVGTSPLRTRPRR